MYVNSGSTIATAGDKAFPLIPSLIPFFESVIIAPFVTSAPEPAVVGIAIIGKAYLISIVFPIIISIDS